MIETGRVVLRSWEPRDREPFAALGRDPEVMATLGPLLSREESDAMIERLAGIDAQHGHTFWAAERKADGALLGFCGLVRGRAGTPIEGEPEIGWRLARGAWGQGYAREAAQACLAWAWANLRDPKVAAITALVNSRSWGLMERLGMVRNRRTTSSIRACPTAVRSRRMSHTGLHGRADARHGTLTSNKECAR